MFRALSFGALLGLVLLSTVAHASTMPDKFFKHSWRAHTQEQDRQRYAKEELNLQTVEQIRVFVVDPLLYGRALTDVDANTLFAHMPKACHALTYPLTTFVDTARMLKQAPAVPLARFLACRVQYLRQASWPEAEAYILKDAEAAQRYAQHGLQAPWPQAEAIIASQPMAAMRYAKEVLAQPWPLAEAVISTSPEAVFEYAQSVLRQRWLSAEPVLAKDAYWAFRYANWLYGCDLDRGGDCKGAYKWVEQQFAQPLEQADLSIPLAQLPWFKLLPQGEGCPPSYYFAALPNRPALRGQLPRLYQQGFGAGLVCTAKTLGQRWAALEHALQQEKVSPSDANVNHKRGRLGELAVQYAINTGRSRWEALEPYILESGQAYLYAIHVLKRGWPELEARWQGRSGLGRHSELLEYCEALRTNFCNVSQAHILKQPRLAAQFAARILKRRWPEFEALPGCRPILVAQYAQTVIGGRWPEQEACAISSTAGAVAYAERVIKGRWPAAEQRYLTNPDFIRQYSKRVMKGPWLEAQAHIATLDLSKVSRGWLNSYGQAFAQQRWPAAEQRLLKVGSAFHLVEYAKRTGLRWPEAEAVLLRQLGSGHKRWDRQEAYGVALEYAAKVMGGRWLELEAVILGHAPFYSPVYYTSNKEIMVGRWLAVEPSLRKGHFGNECSDCESECMRYAQHNLAFGYRKARQWCKLDER